MLMKQFCINFRFSLNIELDLLRHSFLSNITHSSIFSNKLYYYSID